MTTKILIEWFESAIITAYGTGQYVVNPYDHDVFNMSDALPVTHNSVRTLL